MGRTAVIIAGGQGTRIRSVSGDAIPKALVPVAGRPIVFHQFDLLRRYKFDQIVIMAGHLADVLIEGVKPEAGRLGLGVEFVIEHAPLGTAGNFLRAADLIADDEFLVLYGDTAVEMDLDRLMSSHHGADVTIVAHPNDHPHESDLLVTDDAGRITGILLRKQRAPGNYGNLVPAAVYVCSKSVFGHILPDRKQDFIKDVFPRMLKGGARLLAYNTPEYLRDMGSVERYAMVEKHILSGLTASMNFSCRRPAIFLDRDGVLNPDPGGMGVIHRDQMELLPGAAEAVRLINEAGCLAVLVTNQPQLAKGFVSRDEFDMILAKLETLLGFGGAKLDRIYYCPHHPEQGHAGEVVALKVECECRKPAPGLVLRAARDLPIDLERSSMIGDSHRDAGLAKNCGIPFYGVRTGAGCRECVPAPDILFDSVLEAVQYALGKYQPAMDREQTGEEVRS